MKPYALVLLGAAAIAACGDLGVGGGLGALGLTPVLDSIFVGDRLVARQVHYVDSNGNPASPGPVAWGSSDTTVAQIDTVSGAITGRKRGIAIIFARAHSVTGLALVAVSDTLDITLLMDTVYMMPNDTLALPIVVRKATPPAAAVWFTAPGNPAFTVDSLSGVVRATAVPGGPFRYIVHANSITDTGTVTVMTLNDTVAAGGRMFFSVRGTANSHVGGTAQAMNYVTNGGRLAFRLTATHVVNGQPNQFIRVSRPDSVIAPTALAIDSLSISQDTSVATCVTPKSWGVWGFLNGSGSSIAALSRQGGKLSVTSVTTVPGGLAISGHFTFIAQRGDLYEDPLGALAITGSFVAPLVRNTTRCP
jgi:hypothetical protein